MTLTRPLYSIYSIFLVVGLTTFKDMSSHQAYSPNLVEGIISEVRGQAGRARVDAPTLHRPSYEEAGDMGCLGVEYRRGSTGGSSSSISGPIASGSATYSNSPLPSIEGPLAQRPSWLSVPSEKFWNL